MKMGFRTYGRLALGLLKGRPINELKFDMKVPEEEYKEALKRLGSFSQAFRDWILGIDDLQAEYCRISREQIRYIRIVGQDEDRGGRLVKSLSPYGEHLPLIFSLYFFYGDTGLERACINSTWDVKNRRPIMSNFVGGRPADYVTTPVAFFLFSPELVGESQEGLDNMVGSTFFQGYKWRAVYGGEQFMSIPDENDEDPVIEKIIYGGSFEEESGETRHVYVSSNPNRSDRKRPLKFARGLADQMA